MLKKYIVDLLQDNPLNGINANNDVLTLSTGVIIRKIKKLVLTGDEDWTYESEHNRFYISVNDFESFGLRLTPFLSNAFGSVWDGRAIADVPDNTLYSVTNNGIDIHKICIKCTSYTSINDWKSYLATQYAAGTPVTIWYVLANETTEQITVPTGLSGTVDGYTTQSGTPTPTNPIYPTANTVTMWANYTPQKYNGNAFVTATGQPEQYNGGWS